MGVIRITYVRTNTLNLTDQRSWKEVEKFVNSAIKQKTANLHQAAVNYPIVKIFFVIPALAEITSSETLVSEKAP